MGPQVRPVRRGSIPVGSQSQNLLSGRHEGFRFSVTLPADISCQTSWVEALERRRKRVHWGTQIAWEKIPCKQQWTTSWKRKREKQKKQLANKWAWKKFKSVEGFRQIFISEVWERIKCIWKTVKVCYREIKRSKIKERWTGQTCQVLVLRKRIRLQKWSQNQKRLKQGLNF